MRSCPKRRTLAVTLQIALGILFTPWVLGPLNLFSAVLALVSGALVYVALRRKGPLHSWQLMIGGVFYAAFLLVAVYSIS